MRVLLIPNSSLIQGARYDEGLKVLEVTFAGGKRYVYGNFPPDEADAFESAPSAGKHFLEAIKPSYTGTRG